MGQSQHHTAHRQTTLSAVDRQRRCDSAVPLWNVDGMGLTVSSAAAAVDDEEDMEEAESGDEHCRRRGEDTD